MTSEISVVLVCAACYLLGSIPSGLILGKSIWGVDLREHGSQNIGATNAWRTIGHGAGLLIFACDACKGVLAVLLGSWTSGGEPLAMMLAGVCVVAGHCASVFLNFSGGKGVATGLGVIAMLMPTVTVAVFLLWLLIVRLTRYVSLASMVAAVSVPLFGLFLDVPTVYMAFTAVLAVYVIWRHRANIDRLIRGVESKI